VIHNASVMGAIASCGLQLYQFGQTVSVPFFDGSWRPDSFYDKIKYNQVINMTPPPPLSHYDVKCIYMYIN
jgi:diphthine methyl ester synthase